MLLKGDGKSRELVTPPLDGTILPGVTRDSILQLCNTWGEFTVSERQLTIKELKQVTLSSACFDVVVMSECQSMKYAMQQADFCLMPFLQICF